MMNHVRALIIPSYTSNSAALALERNKMWPVGTELKVHFMDGDPVVHKKVAEIASIWSQYANIKFNFDPTNGITSQIRVSFQQNGLSWSFVGTDSLAPIYQNNPTMNFGWLTPTTTNVEFHRVVLHEFGHALGCIHEHQHPEASIPWNEERVYAYYRATNGWDPDKTFTNILQKYSKTTTNFSAYDKTSIMHYSFPAMLVRGGEDVFTSNVELSPTDKQFIATMYPFGNDGALSDQFIDDNVLRFASVVKRELDEPEDRPPTIAIQKSSNSTGVDYFNRLIL